MTVKELIAALHDLIVEDDIGLGVANMEVKWGGGDPENPPNPQVVGNTVYL